MITVFLLGTFERVMISIPFTLIASDQTIYYLCKRDKTDTPTYPGELKTD